MNKGALVIIFLFFFPVISSAQVNEETLPVVEDIIEQLQAGSESESIDFTSLVEDLNYFALNPLNLNDATEDELGKLQFLTDFEVKSILFYMKKAGPMYTVYELQMVYGLSMEKIHLLLPFVTVSPKAGDKQIPVPKAFTNGRHQVFVRTEQIVEEQKGYSDISDSAYLANPNQRYLGSPQKLYFKYKYNYRKKVFWGITAEKDPGEDFFQGTQKNGFDYYSAHVQVNDIKLYKDALAFKTICLGDYELQFGQGLVMWSGLTTGKTADVLNIKKRGYGLKRYTSVDENMFMRGAAATARFKDIDVTGFISRKKIDANISVFDSTAGEATEVSSLQITGLHTTPNEVNDKHAIGTTAFGGNASFNQEYYKVGMSYVRYMFDVPLMTTVKPYNQYEFRGSENSGLALNYQFVYKDIHFYGEGAMSENGGIAYINGMQVKMATQMAFTLAHRSYGRDYQAYYAQPFSESGKSSNEEGIYIGTEIMPHKKIKLTGYYDMYRFPWMKATISAPGAGSDYLVQTDYFVSRNVAMMARFQHEIKSDNASGQTSDVLKTEDIDYKKLRYKISYSVLPNLKLKNRVDFVIYKKGAGDEAYGYQVYQDIVYSFQRIPLSIAARYGIFDTDTYDARIYVYETDVLYGYSIPALYDKGTRAYLMMKYTFFKNLDVWFRVAQTYYANKELIGTGLLEIQGRHKTEATVQVRYKFN